MRVKKELRGFLIMVLSWIIPKKKGFVLLYPHHERKSFSGNLKALYQYVKSNDTHLDLRVYFRHRYFKKNLNKFNRDELVTGRNSVWALLRAELIIIDATVTELSFGRFSIIQLWHGTGYKNIGLLNQHNKGYLGFKIRRHYKKYKCIVSSSEEDKKRKEVAFNNSAVKLLGSPRNDQLIEMSQSREHILSKYKIDHKKKILSYIPTFRDVEVSNSLSVNFWNKMDEYCNNYNAILLIKKHPWDKALNIPESFGCIKEVTHLIEDVQELLCISDTLITDYSSVATDYSLLGKPIIFFFYDYQEYIENCRKLYFDLLDVLPGPFVYQESDIFKYLDDDTWLKNENYIKKYKEFVSHFHYYKDSESSKRVYEEIHKIINQSNQANSKL